MREPKLAYVYDPRSFPTLSLAEAARGVCELVWVIDSSDPTMDAMPALLRRLGTVVDIAGLSEGDAVAAIAREEPDGVLSLADRLLERTAHLAEMLGLPFFSRATATALADKHAQRKALAAAGLPVPGFWLVPEEMDEAGWLLLGAEARFPAVFKPRRGEGSRDTFALASMSQLRRVYEELGSRGGRREFVLEEQLGDSRSETSQGPFADYVSVESVVQGGLITHLAITGRTQLAEPFRETGLFIPSRLEGEERAAVLRMAADAAAALGVERGCLHTEIKLTAAGPVIIEVNGRMGGILPEMLEPALGIQILPIAMRIALGEHVPIDELAAPRAVVYRLYRQPPVGSAKVRSVAGLADLREVPGVDEVILSRGEGQTVDWREGSQGYVFCVAGRVADHAELASLVDSLPAIVRIEWE